MYDSWLTELPDAVRGQLDKALDTPDEAGPAIYARLQLDEHGASLRALQAYATQRRGTLRRPGGSLKTAGEAVAALTAGEAEVSDIAAMALTRVVETIMESDAKPYEIVGLVKAVHDYQRLQIEERRDERDEEKHAAWRKAHNAKVLTQVRERAKLNNGRVTVADVAAALTELDMEAAA